MSTASDKACPVFIWSRARCIQYRTTTWHNRFGTRSLFGLQNNLTILVSWGFCRHIAFALPSQHSLRSTPFPVRTSRFFDLSIFSVISFGNAMKSTRMR
jgi:hypothetical protein